MTYRDPDRSSSDTDPNPEPPQIYPYGHGRWRCPLCGLWGPIEYTVKTFEHDGLLVHKCASQNHGCNGVWKTHTLQSQRDEDRRLALEQSKKERPFFSWDRYLWMTCCFCIYAMWGDAETLRGFMWFAALLSLVMTFGAWSDRKR